MGLQREWGAGSRYCSQFTEKSAQVIDGQKVHIVQKEVSGKYRSLLAAYCFQFL